MAYVYRHIRLDKNEPFYIGIGSDFTYKRAYEKCKSKRSGYWHNIAKNGYDVEIILDGLSWQDACKKEIEFILLYGRKDIGTGILCNMTFGGENPPVLLGNKNPMKRPELIAKLSKAIKGRKLSKEHVEKIRQRNISSNKIPPSRKGCKMSIKAINKMVTSRMENGLTRKKVYQYTTDLKLINEWSHGLQIKSKHKNYSIGNIHMCCRGERKKAYGFIWSFIKLK